MRICIITPPSPFLVDERVYPALGILKVAAVLEQAGHQVDHLDLCGVTNFEDVVNAYEGATTFGITATTPQVPAALRIAAILRAKINVKTILGGAHATLVHASARRGNLRSKAALEALLAAFDVVVAGDGEKAIFTALHSRGLVDADDPKGVLWQASPDFEATPYPAWHLIDVNSYHYYVDGHKTMSMISQLGCPFGCNFCGGRNSNMLRRIRTRSSENVIEEMRQLHERFGIEGIMMLDDELNVNRELVPLMREIAKMGIDWRMRGFVKAELFTDEQAEAMYAAGFRDLMCGFESAHPRILKNINKRATVEDNTRMIRTAHKHGLKVKALMSFGHPGDSEETLLATRDWLIEEKADDFNCSVITLYPGTPYYDDSVCVEEPVYVYETNGDRLYSENIDFTKEFAYYVGAYGDYKAYVWTDYLSRERICQLRDEVEHEVRAKLGIPYASGAAALNYEFSMGSTMPPHILRKGKE